MNDSRHMHNSSSDDFSIKEAKLDSVEVCLLRISRIFCTAHADREHPHWETAFHQACAYFGPTFGPAIGVGMMNILSQMRTARQSGFNFNHPSCKCCREKITDHERHLIRVIQCTRRGDRFSAQAAALLVCEGHDNAPLLEAASELVPLLPFIETETKTRSGTGQVDRQYRYS